MQGGLSFQRGGQGDAYLQALPHWLIEASEASESPAGHDTLDSLFVYQPSRSHVAQASPERLRCLHVHTKESQLQALLQDFLLSPGGYCLLKNPETTLLGDETAAAGFVDRRRRQITDSGWKPLLEFSVHQELPASLCQLLSPSLNPLLRMVPTLCSDLALVEAVVNSSQAEHTGSTTLSSISQAYSNTAALSSSHVSSRPPPNSSSLSSKQFKVPAIDIPSGIPVLGHCAWGTNLQSQRPGGGTPPVHPATGPEHASWDYSWLSALASAPLPLSSSSSAPAGSPLASLVPATPQADTPYGSMPNFSASPYKMESSSSGGMLLQAASSSHALPPAGSPFSPSADEVYPSTPVSVLARSLKGSAGLAIPRPYRSYYASKPIEIPRDAEKLAASYHRALSSGAPKGCLQADGSAATIGSQDWSHVTDSTPSPMAQSEHQIASELAQLVNRWSAEQQLRAALQTNNQASSETPDSKPHFYHGPFSPTFQQPNQGQDQLSNLPLLNVLGQVVTSMQRKQALASSASASSLLELSQQQGENLVSHKGRALPRPSSLPVLHSWQDPIVSAFAVLDSQGHFPKTGDVSLTSSVSSLGEELPLSPCDMTDAGLLLSYERPPNKTERLKMLTKQDLAQFFDMPISEACRQLGVGLTVLKKRCRELGVRRWPHRKLKSMKVLIETVQQLSQKDNGQAKRQIGSAIQRLEAERCNIEAVPTLTLTKETRKFRQACFKAKYKMRSLTTRATT